MRRLVPALQGLLPDADVADVFQSAARQAAQGRVGSGQAAAVRDYQSHASTLPVSIKVHMLHHSMVPAVGPLLTGALQQQISSGSSGSSDAGVCYDPALVQMHSVVFAGCIQMLACVFGIRKNSATDVAAAGLDDLHIQQQQQQQQW
jgi:hypothetical protein